MDKRNTMALVGKPKKTAVVADNTKSSRVLVGKANNADNTKSAMALVGKPKNMVVADVGNTMALVGNPNVGKTSVFNRLTRSSAHVGNWHGVTVESKQKAAVCGGERVLITDLPGLYSLTVHSPEEEVSRDFILQGRCSMVINVCEVNNLQRNLYLTLQLFEAGVPVVVAVNMIDELGDGIAFNADLLASRLGANVIGLSAKSRKGIRNLLPFARGVAGEKKVPDLSYLEGLPIEQISCIIAHDAKRCGLNARFAALKLIENDSHIFSLLKLSPEKERAVRLFGDFSEQLAALRYAHIERVCNGVFTRIKAPKKHISPDKFLLNRLLALPIFLCAAALVFYVTFGLLGKALSQRLDALVYEFIFLPTLNSLSAAHAAPWLIDLVCNGVICGVLGVLTFLPQVVLLFFFLSLMEDSGYISRVAFMTDGLLSKIGLSGRSVFTLLMGFGCSATAVFTARGLEDEAMRKKTVLLTPFMSCSARLPVYAAVAAAFFSGNEMPIILAMYAVGTVVALILAVIFERLVPQLKSGESQFLMEMPPYRLPSFERIRQIILKNTKVFLVRVATVGFAINVSVWFMSAFGFDLAYKPDGSGSILQHAGAVLTPIFAPLGFDNWRSVTALISGLAAKEAVITSINGLGGVEAVLKTQAAAFSFLIFTLLYAPCITALAAIGSELGKKYVVIILLLHFAVAYSAAFVVYNIVGFFF